MSGTDGNDILKHFEILEFDDGVYDVASGIFTPSNSAPEAEDVLASTNTDPELDLTENSGSQTVPNIGTWYVIDLDTGDIQVVPRDATNLAIEDVAPANGAVMHINGNNADMVIGGWTVNDGTISQVDASTIQLTGYAGSTTTNGDWFVILDTTGPGVDAAFSFSGDVDGGSAEYSFQMSGIDFTDNAAGIIGFDEISAAGNFQGDSPEVIIAADVFDQDGDASIFTVDTTGTQGSVINNNDGTFTYSGDGAFEHLSEGESAFDTFTYTATDPSGAQDTATVTIEISDTGDFLF
ncbi:Ig-like domain-containing protein [Leisingera sp. S232]|uniref:Ig-like domain-containing protein n=1 Tax=Leisingera sp. S232 TaxID=3415132 RepID=UPI003C7B3897